MAAINRVNTNLKYERRHPEGGLLYRVIDTYWPIFLQEQERVGRNVSSNDQAVGFVVSIQASLSDGS